MRCFIAEKSREWGCPSPASSIDWITTEKFPLFYGQSHCVGGTGAKPDGHIPTSKGNASLVWGIVPCTRGNEDAERSCGQEDVCACNSLPCETKGQNPSSALVLSSRNNQKLSGISKNKQESAGIGASSFCWGRDPDFRMCN